MNIINDNLKVFNLERSIVMQSTMLQNNILAPSDIIKKRIEILEGWVKDYPSSNINTDIAVVLNSSDRRFLSGILVNGFVMLPNYQKDLLNGIGEIIIDIARDKNTYDPDIFIDNCSSENKSYMLYRELLSVIESKKRNEIETGNSVPFVSAVITFNRCKQPITYRTVTTDKANTLLSENEEYYYENEVKELIKSSLGNDYFVYGKINTNYFELMYKCIKFNYEFKGLNYWERDKSKVEFVDWVNSLPLFTLLTTKFNEECTK